MYVLFIVVTRTALFRTELEGEMGVEKRILECFTVEHIIRFGHNFK